MSNWKDVGQALPSSLKLLGSVLTMTGVGAPVGAAVAGVGALLGQALGADATPDAVLAAVQNDPAAAEKLAELQTNAKVQLQQIAAQVTMSQISAAQVAEQAELADVANARGRQVQTKDSFPNRLAIFVTAGFFGLLLLLVFRDIPAGSQSVVNVMTGSLGTAWIAIISFFYGTTRGSETKNAMISEAQTALSGHLATVTEMLGAAKDATIASIAKES